MGLIEADFTASRLPLFEPPALMLCCSSPTSSVFFFRLSAELGRGSGALRFAIADFGVNGWVTESDFGVSDLVAGDEDGFLLKLYGFWPVAIAAKTTTITNRTAPMHFIILNLRFGPVAPNAFPY